MWKSEERHRSRSRYEDLPDTSGSSVPDDNDEPRDVNTATTQRQTYAAME